MGGNRNLVNRKKKKAPATPITPGTPAGTPADA